MPDIVAHTRGWNASLLDGYTFIATSTCAIGGRQTSHSYIECYLISGSDKILKIWSIIKTLFILLQKYTTYLKAALVFCFNKSTSFERQILSWKLFKKTLSAWDFSFCTQSWHIERRHCWIKLVNLEQKQVHNQDI